MLIITNDLVVQGRFVNNGFQTITSAINDTIVVGVNKNIILVDASAGVTYVKLPLNVEGVSITVKSKAGSSNIVVLPLTGMIDNASLFAFNSNSTDYVQVIGDGTNWWVIGKD